YDVKVGVQSVGGDQYKLAGSVSQAGVSPNFHGFLPLYIEFEKGELLRLAVVTFTGPESVPIATTLRLPKKPVRIVANSMHDVLTR
ncbi:MAG TPA: hypothetical protein VN032_08190, partial [Thermoanaerobaculia bacterium]|nr:hypothetical protein [Thermoanaerobaculia bacterium]